MSNSDRLVKGSTIAVILALCIPAVPVIGTLLDRSNQYRGSDYRDYHARCADCLALASGEISSKPKMRKGYCEPEQPNWCDLAAQYRSAAATESSRSAAWGVFFLTLLGVWLLYRTLEATRDTLKQAKSATDAAWETADTAREIGAHEVRAYLTFESVRVSTSFRADQIIDAAQQLSIHYDVRNSGNSPAKNVKIDASVSCMYLPDFKILMASGGFSKGGPEMGFEDKTQAIPHRIGAVTPGILSGGVNGRAVPGCFSSRVDEPVKAEQIFIQIDINATFEDVFGEKFLVFERFMGGQLVSGEVFGKTVSEYSALTFREDGGDKRIA